VLVPLRAFGLHGVVALAIVEAEIVSRLVDLGAQRFGCGHAVEHAQRAYAVTERARASRVSSANLDVAALCWLARVVNKFDRHEVFRCNLAESLHDGVDHRVVVLWALMQRHERIEDDHVHLRACEQFEMLSEGEAIAITLGQDEWIVVPRHDCQRIGRGVAAVVVKEFLGINPEMLADRQHAPLNLDERFLGVVVQDWTVLAHFAIV
jgi:hypothetical protein